MIPVGDVLDRCVSYWATGDPAFLGQCKLRQGRRLALFLPAWHRSHNFCLYRGGRGIVLLAVVEEIRQNFRRSKTAFFRVLNCRNQRVGVRRNIYFRGGEKYLAFENEGVYNDR